MSERHRGQRSPLDTTRTKTSLFSSNNQELTATENPIIVRMEINTHFKINQMQWVSSEASRARAFPNTSVMWGITPFKATRGCEGDSSLCSSSSESSHSFLLSRSTCSTLFSRTSPSNSWASGLSEEIVQQRVMTLRLCPLRSLVLSFPFFFLVIIFMLTSPRPLFHNGACVRDNRELSLLLLPMDYFGIDENAHEYAQQEEEGEENNNVNASSDLRFFRGSQRSGSIINSGSAVRKRRSLLGVVHTAVGISSDISNSNRNTIDTEKSAVALGRGPVGVDTDRYGGLHARQGKHSRVQKLSNVVWSFMEAGRQLLFANMASVGLVRVAAAKEETTNDFSSSASEKTLPSILGILSENSDAVTALNKGTIIGHIDDSSLHPLLPPRKRGGTLPVKDEEGTTKGFTDKKTTVTRNNRHNRHAAQQELPAAGTVAGTATRGEQGSSRLVLSPSGDEDDGESPETYARSEPLRWTTVPIPTTITLPPDRKITSLWVGVTILLYTAGDGSCYSVNGLAADDPRKKRSTLRSRGKHEANTKEEEAADPRGNENGNSERRRKGQSQSNGQHRFTNNDEPVPSFGTRCALWPFPTNLAASNGTSFISLLYEALPYAIGVTAATAHGGQDTYAVEDISSPTKQFVKTPFKTVAPHRRHGMLVTRTIRIPVTSLGSNSGNGDDGWETSDHSATSTSSASSSSFMREEVPPTTIAVRQLILIGGTSRLIESFCMGNCWPDDDYTNLDFSSPKSKRDESEATDSKKDSEQKRDDDAEEEVEGSSGANIYGNGPLLFSTPSTSKGSYSSPSAESSPFPHTNFNQMMKYVHRHNARENNNKKQSSRMGEEERVVEGLRSGVSVSEIKSEEKDKVEADGDSSEARRVRQDSAAFRSWGWRWFRAQWPDNPLAAAPTSTSPATDDHADNIRHDNDDRRDKKAGHENRYRQQYSDCEQGTSCSSAAADVPSPFPLICAGYATSIDNGTLFISGGFECETGVPSRFVYGINLSPDGAEIEMWKVSPWLAESARTDHLTHLTSYHGIASFDIYLIAALSDMCGILVLYSMLQNKTKLLVGHADGGYRELELSPNKSTFSSSSSSSLSKIIYSSSSGAQILSHVEEDAALSNCMGPQHFMHSGGRVVLLTTSDSSADASASLSARSYISFGTLIPLHLLRAHLARFANTEQTPISSPTSSHADVLNASSKSVDTNKSLDSFPFSSSSRASARAAVAVPMFKRENLAEEMVSLREAQRELAAYFNDDEEEKDGETGEIKVSPIGEESDNTRHENNEKESSDYNTFHKESDFGTSLAPLLRVPYERDIGVMVALGSASKYTDVAFFATKDCHGRLPFISIYLKEYNASSGVMVVYAKIDQRGLKRSFAQMKKFGSRFFPYYYRYSQTENLRVYASPSGTSESENSTTAGNERTTKENLSRQRPPPPPRPMPIYGTMYSYFSGFGYVCASPGGCPSDCSDSSPRKYDETEPARQYTFVNNPAYCSVGYRHHVINSKITERNFYHCNRTQVGPTPAGQFPWLVPGETVLPDGSYPLSELTADRIDYSSFESSTSSSRKDVDEKEKEKETVTYYHAIAEAAIVFEPPPIILTRTVTITREGNGPAPTRDTPTPNPTRGEDGRGDRAEREREEAFRKAYPLLYALFGTALPPALGILAVCLMVLILVVVVGVGICCVGWYFALCCFGMDDDEDESDGGDEEEKEEDPRNGKRDTIHKIEGKYSNKRKDGNGRDAHGSFARVSHRDFYRAKVHGKGLDDANHDDYYYNYKCNRDEENTSCNGVEKSRRGSYSHAKNAEKRRWRRSSDFEAANNGPIRGEDNAEIDSKCSSELRHRRQGELQPAYSFLEGGSSTRTSACTPLVMSELGSCLGAGSVNSDSCIGDDSTTIRQRDRGGGKAGGTPSSLSAISQTPTLPGNVYRKERLSLPTPYNSRKVSGVGMRPPGSGTHSDVSAQGGGRGGGGNFAFCVNNDVEGAANNNSNNTNNTRASIIGDGVHEAHRCHGNISAAYTTNKNNRSRRADNDDATDDERYPWHSLHDDENEQIDMQYTSYHGSASLKNSSLTARLKKKVSSIFKSSEPREGRSSAAGGGYLSEHLLKEKVEEDEFLPPTARGLSQAQEDEASVNNRNTNTMEGIKNETKTRKIKRKRKRRPLIEILGLVPILGYVLLGGSGAEHVAAEKEEAVARGGQGAGSDTDDDDNGDNESFTRPFLGSHERGSTTAFGGEKSGDGSSLRGSQMERGGGGEEVGEENKKERNGIFASLFSIFSTKHDNNNSIMNKKKKPTNKKSSRVLGRAFKRSTRREAFETSTVGADEDDRQSLATWVTSANSKRFGGQGVRGGGGYDDDEFSDDSYSTPSSRQRSLRSSATRTKEGRLRAELHAQRKTMTPTSYRSAARSTINEKNIRTPTTTNTASSTERESRSPTRRPTIKKELGPSHPHSLDDDVYDYDGIATTTAIENNYQTHVYSGNGAEEEEESSEVDDHEYDYYYSDIIMSDNDDEYYYYYDANDDENGNEQLSSDQSFGGASCGGLMFKKAGRTGDVTVGNRRGRGLRRRRRTSNSLLLGNKQTAETSQQQQQHQLVEWDGGAVGTKIGRGVGATISSSLSNPSAFSSASGSPKYNLEHLLGRGGYGMVFFGRRIADGAAVAIKYIKCRSDPELDGALSEFEILHKLRHPNIVPIWDMFLNWQQQQPANQEAQREDEDKRHQDVDYHDHRHPKRSSLAAHHAPAETETATTTTTTETEAEAAPTSSVITSGAGRGGAVVTPDTSYSKGKNAKATVSNEFEDRSSSRERRELRALQKAAGRSSSSSSASTSDFEHFVFSESRNLRSRGGFSGVGGGGSSSAETISFFFGSCLGNNNNNNESTHNMSAASASVNSFDAWAASSVTNAGGGKGKRFYFDEEKKKKSDRKKYFLSGKDFPEYSSILSLPRITQEQADAIHPIDVKKQETNTRNNANAASSIDPKEAKEDEALSKRNYYRLPNGKDIAGAVHCSSLSPSPSPSPSHPRPADGAFLLGSFSSCSLPSVPAPHPSSASASRTPSSVATTTDLLRSNTLLSGVREKRQDQREEEYGQTERGIRQTGREVGHHTAEIHSKQHKSNPLYPPSRHHLLVSPATHSLLAAPLPIRDGHSRSPTFSPPYASTPSRSAASSSSCGLMHHSSSIFPSAPPPSSISVTASEDSSSNCWTSIGAATSLSVLSSRGVGVAVEGGHGFGVAVSVSHASGDALFGRVTSGILLRGEEKRLMTSTRSSHAQRRGEKARDASWSAAVAVGSKGVGDGCTMNASEQHGELTTQEALHASDFSPVTRVKSGNDVEEEEKKEKFRTKAVGDFSCYPYEGTFSCPSSRASSSPARGMFSSHATDATRIHRLHPSSNHARPNPVPMMTEFAHTVGPIVDYSRAADRAEQRRLLREKFEALGQESSEKDGRGFPLLHKKNGGGPEFRKASSLASIIKPEREETEEKEENGSPSASVAPPRGEPISSGCDDADDDNDTVNNGADNERAAFAVHRKRGASSNVNASSSATLCSLAPTTETGARSSAVTTPTTTDAVYRGYSGGQAEEGCDGDGGAHQHRSSECYTQPRSAGWSSQGSLTAFGANDKNTANHHHRQHNNNNNFSHTCTSHNGGNNNNNNNNNVKIEDSQGSLVSLLISSSSASFSSLLGAHHPFPYSDPHHGSSPSFTDSMGMHHAGDEVNTGGGVTILLPSTRDQNVQENTHGKTEDSNNNTNNNNKNTGGEEGTLVSNLSYMYAQYSERRKGRQQRGRGEGACIPRIKITPRSIDGDEELPCPMNDNGKTVSLTARRGLAVIIRSPHESDETSDFVRVGHSRGATANDDNQRVRSSASAAAAARATPTAMGDDANNKKHAAYGRHTCDTHHHDVPEAAERRPHKDNEGQVDGHRHQKPPPSSSSSSPKSQSSTATTAVAQQQQQQPLTTEAMALLNAEHLQERRKAKAANNKVPCQQSRPHHAVEAAEDSKESDHRRHEEGLEGENKKPTDQPLPFPRADARQQMAPNSPQKKEKEKEGRMPERDEKKRSVATAKNNNNNAVSKDVHGYRFVAIATRFHPEGDLKKFIQQRILTTGGGGGAGYQPVHNDRSSPYHVFDGYRRRQDFQHHMAAFASCHANNHHPHDRGFVFNQRLHRFDEEHVVSLTLQIASALLYLHTHEPHRVVHRDLKPENILLASQGQVAVLTDFGLAHDGAQTMGTQAGSLPYVAPEAWSKRYTEKVDVWGLGCVVYGLCTMRVSSNDVLLMFDAVDDPDFIYNITRDMCGGCGYSLELAELVCAMLTKVPQHRLSAAEVLIWLKGIVHIRGYSTAFVERLPSDDELRAALLKVPVSQDRMLRLRVASFWDRQALETMRQEYTRHR